MKSTISFMISCMFISLLISDVQGAKRYVMLKLVE
ncbi:unnamed protein product [Brassica oleracea var. botrytis]|uniref:Uncharacterized protein n=1 Tax=Brassica oleracea TaxID=3712 RepID=A0A3P6F411_BRAOL|nr:unnamed protein product [Brassica oleracea]